MSASDYVATYLNIWSWINDTFMPVQVLNYLQSGKGAQSGRAETAFSNLLGQLPTLAGLAPGTGLPDVFQVQGNQYVRNSLRRVYWGKGAPDEIQNALWLASQCGLVDENSLATYVSSNLGVDCGGFVANYWGIGKPSVAGPSATGWAGFLPRYFWNNAPQLRRADPTQISVDDAAVFFSGVINEDPSIPAQQDPNSPGSYIDGTGSQAFHIGVVSQVNAYGDGTCDLNISESRGALAASGGNGVNDRPLGNVQTTISNGLVYCMDGSNRVYFVGSGAGVSPYMPNMYGA